MRNLERPAVQAIIYAALLWLAAFVCYLAPGVAAGADSARSTLFLALCSVVGFFLSLATFVGLSQAVRLKGPRRVAAGLATVTIALAVHAVYDTLSYEWILHPQTLAGPGARLPGQSLLFLNNIVLLAPVHVTFAVTTLLVFSLRAINARERRLAAALAAAQEAQLAALRSQINPHFLFNSLNAVTALVGAGRSREAETVVARLAAFFRSTLDRPPAELVTLAEEVDLVGAYLDIEAARFGPRLIAEFDLPPALADALVPSFLLQPLVENAVKYAIAPSKHPVTIRVVARRELNQLIVDVMDDGAGASGDACGAGVGLRNVRARLAALYGDNGRLKAEAQPEGFRAEVSIPISFQREALRA